jgi:hypothetical protein
MGDSLKGVMDGELDQALLSHGGKVSQQRLVKIPLGGSLHKSLSLVRPGACL